MNKYVTILVIYSILSILVVLFTNSYHSQKIKEITKENKIISDKIDRLSYQNKKILDTIKYITTKTDSLLVLDKKYETLYEKNQSKIKSLESKYKKINTIDSFSADDIRKYFTNYR